MKQLARTIYHFLRLEPPARREAIRDRRGLPARDPGNAAVVAEAVAWIGRAQDQSRSQDGGVAHSYSLRSGWRSSYPETTGYIVPTLLDYAAHASGDAAADARRRARRMLDWLTSIQFPEGGFQGGLIDSTPVVPVTFNTGQILLGLAAGVRAFGEADRAAMRRAADWLVATQDPDGCWRRFPTPFAEPGEKTYETHVAWGLLEAARVDEPNRDRYAAAALANVHWALRSQRPNGWFENCCLSDPERPLTHTLGYVLRGLIEAYRFAPDPVVRDAARRTADGLLKPLRPDGFLPGMIDADWRGAARWACLTGSAQVASCWLMLYEDTGDARYRDAARAALSYVRRTVKLEGPPEVRGAVKGSFPVQGGYMTYAFPNWAAKFLIDACLLEERVAGPARTGP